MALIYKISQESAEENFALFEAYYDMDITDDDDLSQRARDAVVKAIRLGRVEMVDGDSFIVKQNLKKPIGDAGEMEWAELEGKHKLAMDGCKDSHNYGRAYRLAGALTGVGEAGIKKLRGADLSVAESLGTLFLLV